MKKVTLLLQRIFTEFEIKYKNLSHMPDILRHV